MGHLSNSLILTLYFLSMRKSYNCFLRRCTFHQHRKRQPSFFHPHRNRIPRHKLAAKNLLRQRILDLLLDGAFEWTDNYSSKRCKAA